MNPTNVGDIWEAFSRNINRRPQIFQWQAKSMLHGLSFKGFRSTAASVFVEKVESTFRSKSKHWRFGRIWSLQRPYLLQLNELWQTCMELNVARWAKIKSCNDDNDAKCHPGSQCLRAMLASMAGVEFSCARAHAVRRYKIRTSKIRSLLGD